MWRDFNHLLGKTIGKSESYNIVALQVKREKVFTVRIILIESWVNRLVNPFQIMDGGVEGWMERKQKS